MKDFTLVYSLDGRVTWTIGSCPEDEIYENLEQLMDIHDKKFIYFVNENNDIEMYVV